MKPQPDWTGRYCVVLTIEGEHGEDRDSGHNLEIELRDRCLLNSEQLVWI